MSNSFNFPEFQRFAPPSLPPLTSQIDLSKVQIRSPIVESIENNYASEFYKRLVKWITNFDQSLDNQHEVGVRLVNFGQTVVFHLDDIGYSNPSLLIFSGSTEAGDPVELIQHVSQISILLMKLPRKHPEQPKRPIGFLAAMAD